MRTPTGADVLEFVSFMDGLRRFRSLYLWRKLITFTFQFSFRCYLQGEGVWVKFSLIVNSLTRRIPKNNNSVNSQLLLCEHSLNKGA